MKRTNRYLPLLLIFTFVLVTWFAWNTPFIYPIKLFTVIMHETGHALTAVALGGKVTKVEVNRQQGGVTKYYFRLPAGQAIPGWKRFFIASAGYLGSLIIGSLLLLLSHTRISPWLLWIIGFLLLVETVLFVRDWFTLAVCVIAIAFCGVAGILAPDVVKTFIVRFIATVSCFYAFFDIRDDVFRFGGEQRVGSDAHALQKLTGIPYYVWGAIWIIISIAILYKVLKFITRDKSEVTTKPLAP